jgi:3alpha(or 20beta)-hydroxysteroid dehydrogenase
MFVREGAKVIITDMRAELGAEIARELGPDAHFVRQDVARHDDWALVVAEGEARFGRIDILVNNAGVSGAKAQTAELDDVEYQRIVSINQFGVFLGMKSVIPAMLRCGGGSIVNISSISGMAANYGAPNTAYVGSKFAVRGMTKMTAVEYGRQNIRVNSVHPGFVNTPMMVEGTDEHGGDALSLIPLGRIAEPSEVTNLVVFLASDESSFVTGSEYVIDGMLSH